MGGAVAWLALMASSHEREKEKAKEWIIDGRKEAWLALDPDSACSARYLSGLDSEGIDRKLSIDSDSTSRPILHTSFLWPRERQNRTLP